MQGALCEVKQSMQQTNTKEDAHTSLSCCKPLVSSFRLSITALSFSSSFTFCFSSSSLRAVASEMAFSLLAGTPRTSSSWKMSQTGECTKKHRRCVWLDPKQQWLHLSRFKLRTQFINTHSCQAASNGSLSLKLNNERHQWRLSETRGVK